MITKRRLAVGLAVAVAAATTTTATATASPAQREIAQLRVMTMNMWVGGKNVDGALDKQLAVIKKHRPDVVGLQETAGHTAKDLAEKLGWHFYQSGYDLGVISRFPITSKPETTSAAAGVRIRIDEKTGQEVELWSAHLGYDPYGPYDACFDKMPVDKIMQREAESGRTPQAQELAKALAPKIADADRTPVLLVGDFNSPSHLDWTAATKSAHCGYGPVQWPATKTVEDAGLTDSYRVAHPDPAAAPGATWSPVYPRHNGSTGAPEPQDRIDFINYAGKSLKVKDSTAFVDGTVEPAPDHKNNAWPTDHAAVLTTFTVA